jgi:hypothetical protein
MHIGIVFAVCVKEDTVECAGVLNYVLPPAEQHCHVWVLGLVGPTRGLHGLVDTRVRLCWPRR